VLLTFWWDEERNGEKMKANPICRVCGIDLGEANWYPSCQKNHANICKKCECERMRLWSEANPDKKKAQWTRAIRKIGKRPFSENKECSSFLGVHVAERVLSHVFKDVVEMPYGNPGYDFICNKGMKIDVKSSCLHKSGNWKFAINHNTTADYFLLLAFDNRESLNPLHAWMIPGIAVNHLSGTSISPGTLHKWDEYVIDISKIAACCDVLRGC